MICGRSCDDPRYPGDGRRHRVAESAVRVRDEDVGADGVVDAARRRFGQRRAEHGHGGDKSESDHQSGRRLRRPARAAHGVLPRPRRPEMPSMAANGRPITLAMGRATVGASMPTPMKIPRAPIPTRPMAGAVRPSPATRPRRSRQTPDEDAASRRHVLATAVSDDGRHRGDAHGPSGRADGRDHGDTHPDDERHDTVRASNTKGPDRQRDAKAAQQYPRGPWRRAPRDPSRPTMPPGPRQPLPKAQSGKPDVGLLQRSAAAPARGCVGRR